jgi:tetratricopeptide (TPR) repeat protein
MKKIFILIGFSFTILGLHAQNTHYVDVRVREANNPNYVVESTYEPMSTDMMIAGARNRANKFKEYQDKAYAALNKGDKYGFITYTNYALSMDYYSAKMYYDRGKVFQDLGDYKQAKKNLKKARKYGYYQANQALAELKELTKKKK